MKKTIFTLCLVFVGFVFANGQGVIDPASEIQARQEMLRQSHTQNVEFCTELKQKINTASTPEQLIEKGFLGMQSQRYHCDELLNGQTHKDWKKAIHQDIRYYQQELEKENQFSNGSLPNTSLPPSSKPINWLFWICLLAIPLLVVCGLLLCFNRKK